MADIRQFFTLTLNENYEHSSFYSNYDSQRLVLSLVQLAQCGDDPALYWEDRRQRKTKVFRLLLFLNVYLLGEHLLKELLNILIKNILVHIS